MKNQQIEQFKQQATDDILGVKILDAHRFAELIVQECARIGESKEQGDSEYDSGISVGWYMRQHFGIK